MRLQVRKTTLALLVGALLSSAWPATSQAAVPAQGSGLRRATQILIRTFQPTERWSR
jgi:hypothetical protein